MIGRTAVRRPRRPFHEIAGRRRSAAVAYRERASVPCPAAIPARPAARPPDNLTVETVASGLANPWAIAFLPDGRMLVTERAGRLRIVAKDGTLSPPIAGLPEIFARGQGGLHDVIVDRDFAKNGTIYFCFAMPVQRRRADRARPRAAQSTAIRRGSTTSR